jgi:hypothetical protein
VVVYEPGGLHESVANGTADKVESTFAEVFAHGIGFGARRWDVVQVLRVVDPGLSADKLPDIAVKRAEFLLDAQECSGICDGGEDFQTITNDAGVLHQRIKLALAVACDECGIEVIERLPIGHALSQDCVPTQPRLGTFEDEEFKKNVVIVNGDSPFFIVVANGKFVARPRAARQSRRSSWAVRRCQRLLLVFYSQPCKPVRKFLRLFHDVEHTPPARFGKEMTDDIEDEADAVAPGCFQVLIVGRFEGPVNEHGTAKNVVARDESPETAVVAGVAIIAHGEIAIGRDNDVAIFDMGSHGELPFGGDHAFHRGDGREVVTVRNVVATAMNDVGLVQRLPVTVNDPVFQVNPIAGDADDELHEKQSGLGRRDEDDDVATMNAAVGNEREPCGLWRGGNAVNEEVVPDEQRVFHGTGWNLKGLQAESDDKKANHEDGGHGGDELHGGFLLFGRFLAGGCGLRGLGQVCVLCELGLWFGDEANKNGGNDRRDEESLALLEGNTVAAR